MSGALALAFLVLQIAPGRPTLEAADYEVRWDSWCRPVLHRRGELPRPAPLYSSPSACPGPERRSTQ